MGPHFKLAGDAFDPVDRKHTCKSDDHSRLRDVGAGAGAALHSCDDDKSPVLRPRRRIRDVAVASSLLLIAGVDWICAAGLGFRQVSRLRGFLSLSTAVAACSVFLILYPGSSIRMLCYVLAVYALLLSLGKFGLARSWNGTKREQAVMYILAGVALAFSAALVAFAGQDDRESLALVATYSLFMGFQMLLTMYFLQQPAQKFIEPRPGLNQASV